MSAIDKARNTFDEAKGAVKEKIGELTGDHTKEAEGRKDQAVSDIKQAGEKVKDATQE